MQVTAEAAMHIPRRRCAQCPWTEGTDCEETSAGIVKTLSFNFGSLIGILQAGEIKSGIKDRTASNKA